MHLHYNMVTSNVNARSIEIILSSASHFFSLSFFRSKICSYVWYWIFNMFWGSFSTILVNSFLGKFWGRGFKPGDRTPPLPFWCILVVYVGQNQINLMVLLNGWSDLVYLKVNIKTSIRVFLLKKKRWGVVNQTMASKPTNL